MKITELELKNYRNIKQLSLTPCESVNIIYGENAQGKTNILESIFLFTGLKSFRSTRDKELVMFSEKEALIKTSFSTEIRNQTAQIRISDRRRASLNGVSLRSPVELMGKFPAALFVPGFMSLILSGPGDRRKFIDSAICQIKPRYAVLLTEYTKLLKQRNAVLKDSDNISEIKLFMECINESFSSLGDEIYRERMKYLSVLLPFVEEIYGGLSSGKEKITFSYIRKGDITGEAPFSEILKKHENTDIAARMTLTGIHRDDIDININGISARSFGSQGQKRSAAIALKLGEAEVIRNKINEDPIILLDDVMSELDTSRQDYILNHIRDKQVFVTCCDPASILRMGEGKTFNISDGRLI